MATAVLVGAIDEKSGAMDCEMQLEDHVSHTVGSVKQRRLLESIMTQWKRMISLQEGLIRLE